MKNSVFKKLTRVSAYIISAVVLAATLSMASPAYVHAEEPAPELTQEQLNQLALLLYQQALEEQAKQAAASPEANGYALLGTYTTKYNAKIPRATNVALAANRINGVVLNPGDLFSFTTTILPRTPENGYVSAPVIVNKEFVPGIGGGICQVSSTLYACMLTCGVPALERHPHSLPVSYIPAGMDATISGTAVDLKFVNPYNKPLMISASPDNGSLTVGLWLKN